MGKENKPDRFDQLILNKFNQIKKDEFTGGENEFYDLFVGVQIKEPMKYLIKLVNENPRYQLKNMEEVLEVINFFGYEFFESNDIYELGGTKLFTKLIKKTLSGKYEVDEFGQYDGPYYFSPMELLDTYLDWKYEVLEDSAWGNLWKTFEKLPKIKLYQTVILPTNVGYKNVPWESNIAPKIGWLLNETYSNEKIYIDMKKDILHMAKKQKLKIFMDDDNPYFVREEDSKYFEECNYKLITK